LAITHYVLVRGKGYTTPAKISSALCGFWQKFSDLIGQFERHPVNEVLEPYYFGFRSKYGKIEATHPYFERYWPLVAGAQPKPK